MRQWEQELERLEVEVRRRPKAAAEPTRALLSAVRHALRAAPGDATLLELEARGRYVEAVQLAQVGQVVAAEKGLQKICEERQAAEDHLGVADCLKLLSVVAGKRNDPEAALSRLEECFRLESRHQASKRAQAQTLMQIGIHQAIQEERDSALATLRFAEELLPSGNEVCLGIIRTNLGLLYRSGGDRKHAHGLLRSAVALLETAGPTSSLLNATLELAVEEVWCGLLSDAERRLARAKGLMDGLGYTFFKPEVRLVAARLHLARGQPDRADAELAEAIPQATAEQRCRLLELRAEVAEVAGELATALQWLRDAHAAKLTLIEQRSAVRVASLRSDLGAAIAHKHGNWLREELSRAQAEARSLASQLDDRSCMIASAVHDINNPLSVVLLLSELANSSPDSLQESARAIVEAARHMQGLVTELLGSTAPSVCEPILQLTPTAMRPILDAAQRRYAPVAAAKAQTLHFDASSDASPDGIYFEGDHQAMARVIDNLLSNALKYTPAGGHVELRAHHRAPHVLLEVLDTGPGLSRSDLERVFFCPQRLSARPTQGESQHGIGLVSVRQMVTAMGGRVFVENRLRGGARFVVELMAATPPEVQ